MYSEATPSQIRVMITKFDKAAENYRIVKEIKGDCLAAFRVQKLSHTKYNPDVTGGDPVWRNRGKRMFTIDAARNLREFLIEQDCAGYLPVTYEEITL